jgi:uncharacterized protein YciI
MQRLSHRPVRSFTPQEEVTASPAACILATMRHYLLFYEVGPDYVQRRAQYRSEHLQKARAAQARGELVLAGALAEPVDGAVLLFRAEGPEVAQRFAAEDPYVVYGIVKSWRVREWTTVVGDEACHPV